MNNEELWDSTKSDPVKDIEKAKQWVSDQSTKYDYSAGGYIVNPTLAPTISHGASNKGPNLVRKHAKEFTRPVKCPACGRQTDLNHCIQHLNDMHQWAREAIADWLDTLDSQPIFYPNTCTDDCDKECCMIQYSEVAITAEQLSDYAISSKIVADTVSFQLELNAASAALQKMWDSIFVQMTYKPAEPPIALMVEEHTTPVDLIKSYGDSWKTEITIPDKTAVSMTKEQIDAINKLLSDADSWQKVDQANCTYQITFHGS